MNKQTIELSIPEGYELKEKEPRAPKEGELYYNMRLNKVSECTLTWADTSGVAIILRKTKPVYHVACLPPSRLDSANKYVEIKALEHALICLEGGFTDGSDKPVIEALKELVG